MRSPLKNILLAFAFLMISASTLYAKPHTPKELLLSPMIKIQSDPYFEWVTLKRDNPNELEAAKIEYLIERIRKSPYQFIRNDEEHSSGQAADHLAWKYRRVKKVIRSAKDFIQHIATRSSTSGKLYWVKLVNGKSYPAGEVLTNELETLEQTLSDQLKAEPITTASEQPSIS